MSYVDRNLLPGEQVIYQARLHWIIFTWPMFFLVLGFAFPPLFVLALATGIIALVRRMTSEIAVTDRRVIGKVGFVNHKTAKLLLSKVESLGVDQKMFGRMLGYGTIRLSGTGAGTQEFKRVAAPLELRRQVYAQIEAAIAPAM